MTDDGTGAHPAPGPGAPDDAALLAAVARLWEQADPPPTDLADGVLARLAAEDLELELLVLVGSAREDEALSGVRHSADLGGDDVPTAAEAPAWSLEYEGSDLHVYVRLSRVEDRHRLDGWVVPGAPLTVELRTEGRAEPVVTTADEHGRFEVADAPGGLCRLVFPAEAPARPRVTPPFWI